MVWFRPRTITPRWIEETIWGKLIRTLVETAGSSRGEQKKSRKASREGEESRGDREFGLLRAGCGLF